VIESNEEKVSRKEREGRNSMSPRNGAATPSSGSSSASAIPRLLSSKKFSSQVTAQLGSKKLAKTAGGL